jgi:hypothetical protein
VLVDWVLGLLLGLVGLLLGLVGLARLRHREQASLLLGRLEPVQERAV